MRNPTKSRSAAFGAAMSTSAERRRCPKCNRKSATVYVSILDDEFVSRYCRWDDCDYVRVRPLHTEATQQEGSSE